MGSVWEILTTELHSSRSASMTAGDQSASESDDVGGDFYPWFT